MFSRIPRRCFSTAAATPSPQPWLFVGLGNPGDKFKGTRHNVGFEMIDAFAESQGIPMDTVHCKAVFGKGISLLEKSIFRFIDGVPVLLAKPQTYMNLSGESVTKMVLLAISADTTRSLRGNRRVETGLEWCFFGIYGPLEITADGNYGRNLGSGPLAAYYKLPLNRVLVFHDDMDLPCGVLRLHDKGGHASHNGLKNVIYHYRGNKEFPRLRIGIGMPPGQMDPKAFLLQKFNATARQRIDAALQEGAGALKQLILKGLTESARCFNREQKYKHIRLQTMPT
ncbi:hypothetical protein RJ639_040462 [Escallonia herrerae]|uniref:Peptidyl-tRNA hydrolase n=1 Tax=Escallonia herrerae TaxID=1293975 RepID=A0AA88WG14_9ASTE|nr:hypothetical protein RJ639_040462 [Escallonia herrerae]